MSQQQTPPVTYPDLSVHRDAEGRFFIACGFRKAEHADPATFRVSPFYESAEAALRAYVEKAMDYRAGAQNTVRDILHRLNVTEPSGEWSVFDVAAQLDPLAHKPRSMFDTVPPYPRDEWVELAREMIAFIGPGSRYVGGTSGHLYSL